jgi:hypothetical protein
MSTELEERIRQRAYELWEREGSQHGNDQDHWHQAALEIEEEDREAAGKPKRDKDHQSEAMKAAEAAARAHGFTLEEVAKPSGRKRAAVKTSTSSSTMESSAPKKRGRPKKSEATDGATSPAPKKRGRPKKVEE